MLDTGVLYYVNAFTCSLCQRYGYVYDDIPATIQSYYWLNHIDVAPKLEIMCFLENLCVCNAETFVNKISERK